MGFTEGKQREFIEGANFNDVRFGDGTGKTYTLEEVAATHMSWTPDQVAFVVLDRFHAAAKGPVTAVRDGQNDVYVSWLKNIALGETAAKAPLGMIHRKDISTVPEAQVTESSRGNLFRVLSNTFFTLVASSCASVVVALVALAITATPLGWVTLASATLSIGIGLALGFLFHYLYGRYYAQH
jgi:hypothetical protein